MTDPGDAADEGVDSREREGPRTEVQPLERTAPVYVESTGDYVDIRQPSGDPTLYTPEEAREIAQDILAAAEVSERERTGASGRERERERMDGNG